MKKQRNFFVVANQLMISLGYIRNMYSELS